MSNTTAPAARIVIVHEYKQRDKYGRTVTHVEAVRDDSTRHTVVVVAMPRTVWQGTSYSPARPNDRYLVNDWDVRNFTPGATDAERGVYYFAKRAEALEFARDRAGRVSA